MDRIFSPEAFTVMDLGGAEMLVYVVKQGEPVFAAVSPGQEISFLGTLMPVRDDFEFLVGPAAAPTARPVGAYLHVWPHTITVIEREGT